MLNEDNATGLGVNAEKNIKEVYDNYLKVEKLLGVAFKHLFEGLSKTWASPNAVEFYKKYTEWFCFVSERIINDAGVIAQNAVTAYNIMAKANSMSTIDTTYYEIGVGSPIKSYDFVPLVENISGVSGMNVMQVRNIVLPAFKKEIDEAVEVINDVWTGISLFDVGDEMKDAFDGMITGCKMTATGFVEEMENDINAAIEKEQDTLDLAKNQATDAMRG